VYYLLYAMAYVSMESNHNITARPSCDAATIAEFDGGFFGADISFIIRRPVDALRLRALLRRAMSYLL